jgi:hypothetical protein
MLVFSPDTRTTYPLLKCIGRLSGFIATRLSTGFIDYECMASDQQPPIDYMYVATTSALATCGGSIHCMSDTVRSAHDKSPEYVVNVRFEQVFTRQGTSG